MGFGGEVHHVANAVLTQEALGQPGGPDVALDERESGTGQRAPKARQVAGVGERIENDNRVSGMSVQPVLGKVCPDEPGTSGYEKIRHWQRGSGGN
jgi:hypothetical protein